MSAFLVTNSGIAKGGPGRAQAQPKVGCDCPTNKIDILHRV